MADIAIMKEINKKIVYRTVKRDDTPKKNSQKILNLKKKETTKI